MKTVLTQPDVMIAALGRSGSTLLANLLTTPPARWVMIEPRLANGSTGLDLVNQATNFGFTIEPNTWRLQSDETPDERTERVFGPLVAQLERWD